MSSPKRKTSTPQSPTQKKPRLADIPRSKWTPEETQLLVNHVTLKKPVSSFIIANKTPLQVLTKVSNLKQSGKLGKITLDKLTATQKDSISLS